MDYFVYCSKCGFYPGDYDSSIGITVEDHAVNLANLHSGGSHQCFVIPDTWMYSDTEVAVHDTSI